MTKSYCSLQQSEVSSVESTTDKLLQTLYHPPFSLALIEYVLDHEMSSFLFQCDPSSLLQVCHVDILGNVFERRKKSG
ncbi:hypothetical protein Tco_0323869 [Tanacetum coccineum]